MSTTVRSSRINTGASGTAITLTAPAGTTTGDLVLCFVHVNGQTTIVDNNGSTPFTEDVNDFKPNTTAGQTLSIFSRRIVGGDPASYAFTGGASDRWTIIGVTLQSPDGSTIYDAGPTTGDNSETRAGSITGTSISINTATADAIHFSIMGVDGSSTAITTTPVGAGYTILQNGGNEALAVGYKVIASPGATGAQTWGWVAEAYLAASLAIKNVGTTATLVQTHYRWRNDDGGLIAP